MVATRLHTRLCAWPPDLRLLSRSPSHSVSQDVQRKAHQHPSRQHHHPFQSHQHKACLRSLASRAPASLSPTLISPCGSHTMTRLPCSICSKKFQAPKQKRQSVPYRATSSSMTGQGFASPKWSTRDSGSRSPHQRSVRPRSKQSPGSLSVHAARTFCQRVASSGGAQNQKCCTSKTPQDGTHLPTLVAVHKTSSPYS